MVGEAEVRYNEQLKAGAKPPATQPKFWASNLEDVDGKYHTVTCLDVMIHYPQDKAGACCRSYSCSRWSVRAARCTGFAVGRNTAAVGLWPAAAAAALKMVGGVGAKPGTWHTWRW
jgi:hypothetical protein